MSAGCDRTDADGSQTPETTAATDAPVEQPVVAAAVPRLAVVIVVDQMRADYFERFDGQLEGGLARLATEGVRYVDAHHAHAITNTAPGHATISTGTHPAQHGIVSNKWLDDETGEKVMAVHDPTVAIIGKGEGSGISPKNLMREGLGDWVHEVYPEARVVSVSLKDRAAMMLGGKHPDAAIWYEDDLGRYTTSTYYGETLPAWVTSYNERDRATALFPAEGWTPLLPDEAYAGSRATTEKVNTYDDYALTKRFPHTIAGEGITAANTIRQTPWGDQMTLELARAAIDAEQLGADEVPDVLLVSLSGGDYVGHRYGPLSKEMHDYYLRMDRYLGEFLGDLDQRFGDDYVLAFTSDHGVVPAPEFSGIETAGRLEPKMVLPGLAKKAAKKAKLRGKELPEVTWTHGVEVIFGADVAEEKQAAFRKALVAELVALPEIADAFESRACLADDWASHSEQASAWANSYYPGRAADIFVQLAPGVVPYAAGSTHGTPYDFDNHVPIVLMTPDLPPAIVEREVHTVDVAPTVATMLGVAPPAWVMGEPLPTQ